MKSEKNENLYHLQKLMKQGIENRWLQKKKPVKENIKVGKQHALEMPNERDSPLSANGDEELRLTGNGDSESNNVSDYNTRYENRQQGVTVSSIIDRLRIGSEWYRGEII